MIDNINNIELLDGAMGSEFIKRGISLPNHIWSAHLNLEASEVIYKIHKEYLDAGAHYLTTNTFRSTPRAYSKIGLPLKEAKKSAELSLKSAIKIAKNAANTNTKILGSIAPLEDCYSPELFPGPDAAKKEFRELGKWFNEEGVDIFLLETMNNSEEILTGVDSLEKFNKPIWVSMVLKNKDTILSGESLSDVIKSIKNTSVECLLLNCSPIGRTYKALSTISDNWKRKWGIYPNLGRGEPSPDGNIKLLHSNEDFINLSSQAVKLGGTIIGGCCGSNPKHIEILRKTISLPSN